ncbi:uncharacterized protein TRIADDRAFT_55686 [Trichoplax adhaerens]|uniref:Tetratricopeptide repeat protein 5 OB fold domain-containing protein n=1 Tax=Trichoplax adhaerens TaxID=10228 RepID=B3RVK6_TRIAD|nr:hypothetical protein TRIADDRAFT_55686 [Trichoplax adhaerens]EDV26013.1 hypothetical protein TRIADDRAFT_55686 [Trichoplax adhaerens]|eukprot:XP_002112046.1 hypothetical protein TRIADDRAFT_55686 [Trichoplax adhaerens]
MAEFDEKQFSQKLETAEKSLQELYHMRDHFFELYPVKLSDKKYSMLREKMSALIAIIDQIQEQTDFRLQSKEYKFKCSYIKGKALNVLPDYSDEAEKASSLAVKLDPTSIDAWNNLGECYWKKKNMEAAKNCFNDAITRSRNKDSLRRYSMVLRQLGSDTSEKFKNICESVDIAKEAVSLDVSDGNSWLVLGNAYLARFFAGGQSPKILQQSLSSYSQADKDSSTALCSDLHFNRATVYKYQEEYQKAMEGYDRALQLEPTWTQCKERLEDITSYLKKIMEFIETKGKIKQKRLTAMLQSLTEKSLGPFAGGNYSSPSGKTIKLNHIPISGIRPGINNETVISGKILGIISYIEPVPYVFIMADSECDIVAVSVYNLASNASFNIGDAVAIPEPYVQTNDFSFREQHFKFVGVRVENPVVMVVNGKKLHRNSLSPMFLSITSKSE